MFTRLFVIALWLYARPGYGVVPSSKSILRSVDQDVFPTDMVIRKQVAFWQLVFQKYPSSVSLIHDLDEPSLLIDIVDLNLLNELKESRKNMTQDEFNRLTKSYVRRYQQAVERFHQERDGALKYGSIEDRVYQVYARNPRSLAKLYNGKVVIRAQQGLADTFLQAAQTAQKYLPYMEETFAKYGLPKKLTRLPFVESMFNLNARSKVGASGIWQFMPETARHYMYVEGHVDERNSPYKATRAAAQFMLDNYRELGSWPLAVTAYNHGRSGLERASRQLRTRELGQMILRYESPSFGFASKNFYAEFLAASMAYDHLLKENKLQNTKNQELVAVTLPNRMSVASLIGATKLNVDTLVQNNPCLLSSAFDRYYNSPLPQNYQIWLPKNLAKVTRMQLSQSSSKRSVLSRR